MSRHACPRCGAPLVPIAFGLPAPELEDRAAAGDVILGGCMIRDDGSDATHGCRACGEWAVVHAGEVFAHDDWLRPRRVERRGSERLSIVLRTPSGDEASFAIARSDEAFPHFAQFVRRRR